MNCKLLLISLLFISFSSFAASLEQKILLYGIVKPKKVTTLVAIGEGIVNKIFHQVGEEVQNSKGLLQVFEKESIRVYRNTILGKVAKVHVTEGAAVSPGMPLVTVVDDKVLYFEFSLSPDQADKIAKGNQIYLKQNQKVASIEKVSPIVDPENGAVLVQSTSFEEKIARIGEVVPVTINLGTKNCDLVAEVNQLGEHIKTHKVLFVSENKACLVTMK